MTESANASSPYSGEELWVLTEELRMRMFKATLFLAALLVLPAVSLVVVIDEELGIRLALLAVVGTLCALGAAEVGWCYRHLRAQQWWVLLPAILAAGVLIVGGARQNSTFIVIGTAMVGTPVVIELASAMVAGSIVVFGYAVSILVHQQSLLVDGSAGDLAALISFLMAIYTANRVAELAVLIVADVNRDAREVTAKQPVPDRILAQEATDGTADDVLGRLSEYNLTPAQRRVAHLAGDGLGQKAIAERLGKSPRTVGNQLREVKNKLAVKTHAELTFRVQQLLALPPQEAHLPPRDP